MAINNDTAANKGFPWPKETIAAFDDEYVTGSKIVTQLIRLTQQRKIEWKRGASGQYEVSSGFNRYIVLPDSALNVFIGDMPLCSGADMVKDLREAIRKSVIDIDELLATLEAM